VATAPAPAPATARGLATRVRGRLARQRLQPAQQQPQMEVGGELAVALKVADALLAALHQSDRGAVAAQLFDSVTLRIVDGTGERELVGRDVVADALLADDAWRGEQVFGQSHPGAPTFTLALGYARNGARAWRMLCLQQREQTVRSLTLYRL
jgi:hypothetical protein